MSLSNITSATLHSLVKLTEKKESLLAEIQKIEAELSSALTGGSVSSPKPKGRPAKKAAPVKKSTAIKKAPAAGKVPTAKKASVKSTPAKRGKAGGLKGKVIAALEAAGETGVKVTDLAKTLKVKGTSLHVWFATTGKKTPGIKKVGKGHYQLVKQ